ncbi:MAG: hypothetical protein ACRDTR_23270 [Rubrobacter sp.]
MSDATDTEFTSEEILSQAQGNATGLALASIAYMKERNLAADEYIAFVGSRFASGWEDLRGQPVREIARMAALNFVSVGGTLLSLSGDEARAEVLITGWPAKESLDELELTQRDSEPMWNILGPIMEHLGIRYAWQRQDEAVRMTFERVRTQ